MITAILETSLLYTTVLPSRYYVQLLNKNNNKSNNNQTQIFNKDEMC